ncbi:group II intron reverse transcriptase/maturase [Clostridium estertheticum]|uniref:group II intron reverse transcriptase/maturase n=1 Tax=Clostridium estertheticum TaxID=238834 RepID=UPI001C0B18EA|nr:group II intron reverse transcriptase/maturase [Clostridium estertheticum]MBU3175187.1 group II intron reverse transcriptase/maturase [Clostridium estertheticum]
MRKTSIYRKSTLSPDAQWKLIDWFHINKYVERLQQRIYCAECLGNKRKVRSLQRILVRSKAMMLISIKRVTQINKGKKTAGVDGEIAIANKERLKLFNDLSEGDIGKHKAKPSHRTYIKKKNGKLRPLSIPTIRDRIYQNIIKGALEPQWEARFEPISYGFRPKRGCCDAITRIFLSCHSGSRKRWIFEGDFKGCFDNLNHDYIMEQIKEFPYSNMIGKWLKAGYVDNGVFNETEFGSGQGSIVSPLLANIALMGMEDILGIKYKPVKKNGKIVSYTNVAKYTLVFYADDFVVMCNTKKDAEDVYELLKPYLDKRGLELSKEKTRVVTIDEGFNFLGLNVRMYQTCQGEKLLIKPSKESIKKSKETISTEIQKLKGKNVGAVINKINPIITGIGNYWSAWVAKHTYSYVDHHIWWCTFRFLKYLHPKKSKTWIINRYYKPDIVGQSKNKWILTDPKKNKQLTKMSWIPIVRHRLIKFRATPYDSSLKGYFSSRDEKEFNRNCIKSKQKMAKIQNYKCPICNKSITDFTEKLEVQEKVPGIHGGTRKYTNLQLVHRYCNKQYYKIFPLKGELPTKQQKQKGYKIIRQLRLAEIL